MGNTAKYRMTDADMQALSGYAPNIEWAHSSDGGASARVGSLRLWVTRENPYKEPRGGWMVQILDGHYEELIRLSSGTLPGALLKALRQVDMEAARWALLAGALVRAPKPVPVEVGKC